MARPARGGRSTPADQILDSDETSLLDVVDNALTKGVVLNGELTLALAHVDLVYARLSVLLCAADRVLPRTEEAATRRRGARGRRR